MRRKPRWRRGHWRGLGSASWARPELVNSFARRWNSLLKRVSDQRRGKERAKGFEPSTSALGTLHSTTELRPHCLQTIDQNRWKSTAESLQFGDLVDVPARRRSRHWCRRRGQGLLPVRGEDRQIVNVHHPIGAEVEIALRVRPTRLLP